MPSTTAPPFVAHCVCARVCVCVCVCVCVRRYIPELQGYIPCACAAAAIPRARGGALTCPPSRAGVVFNQTFDLTTICPSMGKAAPLPAPMPMPPMAMPASLPACVARARSRAAGPVGLAFRARARVIIHVSCVSGLGVLGVHFGMRSRSQGRVPHGRERVRLPPGQVRVLQAG